MWKWHFSRDYVLLENKKKTVTVFSVVGRDARLFVYEANCQSDDDENNLWTFL